MPGIMTFDSCSCLACLLIMSVRNCGIHAIFAIAQESQIQPKEKWKFLQKYWHKGAFFQETSDNPYSKDQVDDVYTRDYSAPTGEDKLDKSVLPKVMQVRLLRSVLSSDLDYCVGSDVVRFMSQTLHHCRFRCTQILQSLANTFILL